MTDILDKVKELTKSDNILVVMKFGSHLYGTNTPESDEDYKAIYIPSIEDVILGTTPRTSVTMSTGDRIGKNTSDDIDIEAFHLRGFMKMCEEGQVVSLDMLFAPEDMILYKSPAWDELIKNRKKLLHKRTTAFVGYCKKQTAKYGIKGSRLDAMEGALKILGGRDMQSRLYEKENTLRHIVEAYPEFFSFGEIENPSRNIGGGGTKNPHAHKYIEFCNKKIIFTVKIQELYGLIDKVYKQYGDRAKKAQSNEGVDFKAVSHAIRVCYQAIELLEFGHITMPLKKATMIKKIKQGKFDYIKVAEKLEALMDELQEKKADSILPEECDKGFIERFCVEQYLKGVYNVSS